MCVCVWGGVVGKQKNIKNILAPRPPRNPNDAHLRTPGLPLGGAGRWQLDAPDQDQCRQPSWARQRRDSAGVDRRLTVRSADCGRPGEPPAPMALDRPVEHPWRRRSVLWWETPDAFAAALASAKRSAASRHRRHRCHRQHLAVPSFPCAPPASRPPHYRLAEASDDLQASVGHHRFDRCSAAAAAVPRGPQWSLVTSDRGPPPPSAAEDSCRHRCCRRRQRAQESNPCHRCLRPLPPATLQNCSNSRSLNVDPPCQPRARPSRRDGSRRVVRLASHQGYRCRRHQTNPLHRLQS